MFGGVVTCRRRANTRGGGYPLIKPPSPCNIDTAMDANSAVWRLCPVVFAEWLCAVDPITRWWKGRVSPFNENSISSGELIGHEDGALRAFKMETGSCWSRLLGGVIKTLENVFAE